MCGIAGIIGPGACLPPARQALAAMTKSLAPRGPDEESFWFEPEGRAALGFRRLSILDISGGHQPATNESANVHVVFNGEIYNFPELQHRLQALGHKLSGRGDTATIPHLYEVYGHDLFQHLRGMFAIAIWDSNSCKLTLGRDRFGQKPFVYRQTPAGQFHFASELKALRRADPLWQPTIDPVSLDQYLAFGYVPAPRTIFQNVWKLPPGHLGIYENRSLQVQPYWQINWQEKTSSKQLPLNLAAREFRAILQSAIAEQNVADVPIGVFLSGGVDSSLVAALSARLVDQPLRSFSVSFDDLAFDESPQAEAFAATLGANHTTIRVDFKAWETLNELTLAYDEPLADNSALPTWLLSRETSKHLKVVLSGDGGDELALGYDRYRAIAIAERIRANMPASALKFLATSVANKIPASARAKTRGRRIKAFLQSLGLSKIDLFSKWLLMWNESQRFALYSRDQIDCLLAASEYSTGLCDPLTILSASCATADGRELARQAQAMDVGSAGYLSGDLMYKIDIATMAHSLECRSPLLDHRLAEFAAKLPLNYLVDPFTGQGKRIFREACADILPAEIFKRRKMGFAAPVDRWLRGPLADHLKSALLSAESRTASMFNRDTVNATISEHITGQSDHAYRLWSLLTLELWMKQNL